MKLLPTIFSALLIHQIHANIHRRLINQIYADSGLKLTSSYGADVGDPLILTPYLQEGKIQEAQEASLVENDIFLGVTSYSGYFTVDERFDSNIWFWFFPSADNVASDPVVLWLNGGPGASSLNGLFDENGPFIVDENSQVSLREYSWHKNQSLLFIDNPVGVGFSFTNGGLALNETKVGEDMHSALTQFFQLFPELQQNDFFISGESYGGKYLPAIGYTILQKNPQADLKINLQGILIGDGWTDPIHQVNYGPYVYNTGLVSSAVVSQIATLTENTIDKINEGDYERALYDWDDIISLITSNSKLNIYNYLEEYDDPTAWPYLLTTNEIRKAIHVGNITFGDKGAGDALSNDMLQSIAPWVETLLENYRVLVFTGQVDIIVGYPMVLEYLSHLNFSGAEEYQKAPRYAWMVGNEPAGYVRSGGNLVELLVRNAGHMVPRDQPQWGYDMLYRFTRNKPFA